ncbi:MAG: PAS domain-containing protein [Ferruginibacter sp.]|nr:PAS domain-containing protein [Cytophagales bacterium]
MSTPEQCQRYYASIPLVHPLIMGGEFLPWSHLPRLSDDSQHLNELAALNQWVITADLQAHLTKSTFTTALVVTDPYEHIQWVNAGFTRMTGYAPAEATGRHPNFLQGKGTSAASKKNIRHKLTQRQVYCGTLLNYRKNQQPYRCQVRIFPVYSQSNGLINFIAIENELVRS